MSPIWPKNGSESREAVTCTAFSGRPLLTLVKRAPLGSSLPQ